MWYGYPTEESIYTTTFNNYILFRLFQLILMSVMSATKGGYERHCVSHNKGYEQYDNYLTNE